MLSKINRELSGKHTYNSESIRTRCRIYGNKMKNWHHAAFILWPILVKAARNKSKYIYSQLAPKVPTNPLSMRYALAPIMFYCEEYRYPPLTALVINKSTKLPGQGFTAWDIDDLEHAYELIYSFNWENIENPFECFENEIDTVESFTNEIIENPNNAINLYTRVKSRGIAQIIFREILLKAYDETCAICGLTFVKTLDAAHIIPWGDCSNNLRMDPRNGILLCKNHHKLFDEKILIISPSYTINYEDPNMQDSYHSNTDKFHVAAFHGKKMKLPDDKTLRPYPELLKKKIEITIN